MRMDRSRIGTITVIGLLTLGCLWITMVKMMPVSVVERHAGAAEPPHGTHNQQLWWVPVPSQGQGSPDVLLETMVYRPAGAGPFPLVVIYHGKPARNFGAAQPGFDTAARWFVDLGFAVAVPLRQGYGHSQGSVNDMVGSCDTMDYYATAKQTARDAEGVITFMQQQSFVEPKTVIVVGHSHGGLGALGLASDAPDGVVGIINFAGGSGAWKAGPICNGRANLIGAMHRLGLENKLPQAWLYALDDETFGPALAKEMWRAYSSNSQVEIVFLALPATGGGHMLFPNGNAPVWGPAVRQFLLRLTH
jgi:dienelactone hydrolase